MRPAKNGYCAGSPWMWVWQSQASAGISKFTAVFGCEALAKLVVLLCIRANALVAPIRACRRVNMGFLRLLPLGHLSLWHSDPRLLVCSAGELGEGRVRIVTPASLGWTRDYAR